MKKLLICFILSLAAIYTPISLAADNETPADQLQTEEQQALDKKKKKVPTIEIHGDYRLLYGEGRFNFQAGRREYSQRLIMPTQRARIFITGHLNDTWVIKSEFEDNRNSHDHSGDHYAYMGRLYLEGETKAATKYMLGRFNYYVLDGNTLDTRVDGARIRVGHDDTVTASLFYGRTVHGDSYRVKEGVIGTLTHEQGPWLSRLSYFNMHNVKNAGPNELDRQIIWSWNNRYQLSKDFYTSLELLRATGTNSSDGYDDLDHGFVWSLNFRPEVNPAHVGEVDAWIKYYRQPRSSIIIHTMDGDPLFFRRLGFTGWGARVDTVLAPGLVLAAEGFIMHNYRNDRIYSNMTEKILGTSLTLYF